MSDEPDLLPTEAITRRGDLWLMGEHRLLCGDSTDPETVDRVTDGEHIDAIVTDPPYGIEADYRSFNDTMDNVKALIKPMVRASRNATVTVITTGQRAMWFYPPPTWMLAWVHPAGNGAGPWGFACLHPILAYGADPYLARGLGSRPDTLVLAAGRGEVEGHPVVKPLPVWSWLIERVTPEPGQMVLDLFAGSGTTIIGAEQLERRARAIEIDPAYCDVIVARWEKHTGRKATLA